jgi:DNA-binding transcriptional LysR family regulator
MDQLEAIRMFVRVVDSASLSAVAREAGIGQPAVSKQIAALEARLGAQLLRRTSRSLSVTHAGQDFYESAVRLLDDLDTAVSRVGRGQTAGLIRVTVAPAFGRLQLLPRLGDFFARFPDIVGGIVVTDRAVDLVREGVGPGASRANLARSSISPRGACVRTMRSRFARRSSRASASPIRPAGYLPARSHRARCAASCGSMRFGAVAVVQPSPAAPTQGPAFSYTLTKLSGVAVLAEGHVPSTLPFGFVG